MKDKNRVIIYILVVLFAVCLIVGCVFLFWDHPDILPPETESVSETLFEERELVVQEPVKVTEDDASVSLSGSDAPELNLPDFDPSKVVEEKAPVENPYKDWFLKNDDMVAWIKIPDTCVDYPVMWTPEDEEYYLRKDFNKKYDKAGVPFLDTESSMYPMTTNLIIYGHNFEGIMFYDVLKYENESYFKDHPYLYLYGKDCEHKYAVMAAFRSRVYYTTDTCFKYYKFFQAETEEEFKDFYDNVKELSYYDTGVTASFGDRFVTLSTCSDHLPGGVGRFVLVAVEIESGDKYLSIDESTSE
ncbi:MAG: class B sortase [Lachnospiraceae bacterium]|nr:class B sortase [Lachnospiraceae bacterium]